MKDPSSGPFNTKAFRFSLRVENELGSIGIIFQIPQWDGLFYTFPPFPLPIRVIEKIKREGSDMIFMVIFWPLQRWFSDLMDMTWGQYI